MSSWCVAAGQPRTHHDTTKEHTTMEPVEAEARDDIKTIEVEYNGQTFTFPADLERADGDVIEALDDQKLSYALKGLLAADQYAAFKKTKPRVGDYANLFNKYLETIGLISTGD